MRIESVMPALVAGIHVYLRAFGKDVHGRDKPGHDRGEMVQYNKRSRRDRG
jgi:hypothetical protein